MEALKRIAKNTAIMFAANVVKKLITLFLTMVVARYLGVENFGKLAFATSFVVLFSIFTDFGAKVLINREIARNKDKANKYVSNVLSMKLVLSTLMIVAVGIAANLLGYPKDTIYLLYISSVILIVQTLGEPINSSFRAYEVLKYNATTLIVQSVLQLGFAFLVIRAGLGVKELLYAYLASDVIGFFLKFYYYNANIMIFKWEFDMEFAKNILKSSVPFGVAALLMTLYDKVDITMLSKMVSNPDAVIGWYSAAYNLLYVFEFIPVSIGAAIYSYTSLAFLNKIEKFKFVYRKMVTYYFYFTIPLVVGTMILAKSIIEFLYGAEYQPAVLALQILIWSVLFKFQMYALGVILNSMNKEKLTMKATMVSLAANVILNLILIPKMSFIGASIATVTAELLYFVICFIGASKSLEKLSLLKIIYKPLLASLVMIYPVMFLDKINLFLAMASGAIIYCLVLLLVKAFPTEDIDYAKNYLSHVFRAR